jgi:putative colanic acid biosysnthesis UDP-glucose lipid carrier transferase
MQYIRGRYSWLIRPLLVCLDLFVINAFAFYLFDFNQQELYFFPYKWLNNKHIIYLFFSVFLWLFSTSLVKFYQVYRYTSILNILGLIVKQFVFYTIIFYAFIGLFRSINLQAFETLNYLLICFGLIGTIKIISYYTLKYFRVFLNGNVRSVIIIGHCEGAQELANLFTNKKELGYRLKATFADADSKHITGNIKEALVFLKQHPDIDEIYCSVKNISTELISKFVNLADINQTNIKFIPEGSIAITSQLKTEYYDYVPVLSMPDIELNNPFNLFIKRLFDVIFSLGILIFIMSWLTPILFILIKLQSRGPLFFVHKRHGINYKEFTCYKFRSLTETKETKGSYVTKDDKRLTKIGRFLRSTSLDELPQFYNVLLGDMSIVGPRPHMLSYTESYAKIIDKYSFYFRHNVKPGITGLAQIKGFRGEIKSESDIINRIKYDIFYLENWSLLLDMQIILKTIFNIFKGDEKAY